MWIFLFCHVWNPFPWSEWRVIDSANRHCLCLRLPSSYNESHLMVFLIQRLYMARIWVIVTGQGFVHFPLSLWLTSHGCLLDNKMYRIISGINPNIFYPLCKLYAEKSRISPLFPRLHSSLASRVHCMAFSFQQACELWMKDFWPSRNNDNYYQENVVIKGIAHKPGMMPGDRS